MKHVMSSLDHSELSAHQSYGHRLCSPPGAQFLGPHEPGLLTYQAWAVVARKILLTDLNQHPESLLHNREGQERGREKEEKETGLFGSSAGLVVCWWTHLCCHMHEQGCSHRSHRLTNIQTHQTRHTIHIHTHNTWQYPVFTLYMAYAFNTRLKSSCLKERNRI